jgi:hypothetical protein
MNVRRDDHVQQARSLARENGAERAGEIGDHGRSARIVCAERTPGKGNTKAPRRTGGQQRQTTSRTPAMRPGGRRASQGATDGAFCLTIGCAPA